MNKKIIVGTLLGCLFGATVGYSASVVTLPHTFTAGTAIKASEVNANFSALAQEIASIKDSVSLSKSSDFTVMAIAPVSAVVGSTITIGTKNFTLKQKPNIEDPITGKKYTLNYPAAATDVVVRAGKCPAFIDSEIAVKMGSGNGFTSYVYYTLYNDSGVSSQAGAGIKIQLTDNLCAYTGGLDTSSDISRSAAVELISRVTELQRYISVQAL